MTQTTFIRLKGVTFANDSLAIIKDYRQLVALDPSCSGAWRFDVPELMSLDGSGGILSVSSWKDSTLLSFNAGTDKATLSTKAGGGKVAVIPAGTSYIASSGVKIDGTKPYSILVIAKPNSYATQQAIAGAPVASGGNNIRIEALTGSGVASMRNVRGAALPITTVLDPTLPVAFLASFDGTNTKATDLFGGTSSSAAAVTSFAGLSFLLGSSTTYPFAGEVDFVALFTKDITLDPDLLDNVKELARLRIARL